MDCGNLTKAREELQFEDGNDRGRIIVSGDEADGRYSLMEWTIGATPAHPADAPLEYFPHQHGSIEETFYIQSGELEFLMGEEIVTLKPGDHIRVPPGMRHGYANRGGDEVRMLVTFIPGGFEQLFVKYRTDQPGPVDDMAFMADAEANFDSTFET